LIWWYWLGAWECVNPQGLGFNSLWCQFKWASLASSKKLTCTIRVNSLVYIGLELGLFEDGCRVIFWRSSYFISI